ncbi:hypothetical protein AC249_AIPGENE18686 [Exaiptasia diaphana]|nr:hypothetical protein AC249_AIPGENE18686 [Exaiptasia diaphana]
MKTAMITLLLLVFLGMLVKEDDALSSGLFLRPKGRKRQPTRKTKETKESGDESIPRFQEMCKLAARLGCYQKRSEWKPLKNDRNLED